MQSIHLNLSQTFKMPLCTLFLISLDPSITLPHFLTLLPSDRSPITTARVVRWIIRPTSTTLEPLLHHPLDLLLILPGTEPLTPTLARHTRHIHSLSIGVPTSLLTSYPTKNASLLHPTGSIPTLTGSLQTPLLTSSAQSLAFTPELTSWLDSWDPLSGHAYTARGTTGVHLGRGPVSMLNLLCFNPGAHAAYAQYGAAFASAAGARRGGNAKIVGKVLGGAWDEVALAHYPSIRHFADMAASEDYQEINTKWRVGALKDTCILMTSEVEVEREVQQERMRRGRL